MSAGRGESFSSDGEEEGAAPKEADCVVIVGSERTINMQVTDCERVEPDDPV
jgi:hypothetical protein